MNAASGDGAHARLRLAGMSAPFTDQQKRQTALTTSGKTDVLSGVHLSAAWFSHSAAERR
jgi:hypothetical protein